MLAKPPIQLPVVPIDRLEQKVLRSLACIGVVDVADCMTDLWVFERVVEPDGDEGIIVMPASGDDMDGPTLAIWEHEGSYRVDELRWDNYRTVAHCTTFADVLTEVRRRMLEAHPYLN